MEANELEIELGELGTPSVGRSGTAPLRHSGETLHLARADCSARLVDAKAPSARRHEMCNCSSSAGIPAATLASCALRTTPDIDKGERDEGHRRPRTLRGQRTVHG